jgi:hypothetical protein
MKTVAGILILTNVVLAGVVIALLAGRRAEIPSIPVVSAPEAVAEPSAPAVMAPKPEPFRWSQLEATDYPTYVGNLRAIGCPEQTLRDIITADVDEAIYAPKRGEMKRKEPAQSLERALMELKRGEDRFIASLLGTAPPSSESESTETVAATQRPARGPSDAPVTVPLVFQNIDPVAAGLGTNMAGVVASVRQRFLQELGSQQDPNDPAYRERWKKAQADADSQLRGMIGLRAFQAYQYRARVAAASPTSAQPGSTP